VVEKRDGRGNPTGDLLYYNVSHHRYYQSPDARALPYKVTTGASATIAALVVAQVVLIADMLPFINRFPEKPLIYNTV